MPHRIVAAFPLQCQVLESLAYLVEKDWKNGKNSEVLENALFLLDLSNETEK